MTSNRHPTVRCIAARLATSALISSACAVTPRYVEPKLPADEAATVTLDERAKVLTIEDLPVESKDGGGFLVEPGCRTLTAKYEESFFIWGEKKAKKTGAGSSLSAALANTENHDYETTKPIRFYFDAKAGHKYWVTASFTGDQFLPRLVELDAGDEASATYLPDVPCGRK